MKSVFGSKKAQITVFIIIGLIILFSVGIYSYMKIAEVKPVDILQPKAPPVVAFIDACLERVAKEAILDMGDQGGYISVPPDIALNPSRHVSLIPGTSGTYAPKVPYWYFDGRSRIPGLSYMAVQVEEYVNQNLEYCLQNFSTLRDEYDIEELSNFSADVEFAEKDTVIGLDYKIRISPKGGNEVTERETFTVKLDVQVKRMWNLSKEILEAENQMTFFENMTLNLMGSYPPEDIPFTGLSLDCNRKRWLLSDVKKNLIKGLEPAVSAIRFKNTNHPPFKDSDAAYAAVHTAVENWRESPVRTNLKLPKNIPEDSYDYFQYYFQFTENDYKNFNVVSTFKKDWTMSLLGTPNEYGVLKSGMQDLKSEILSYLCLNTYHFVYDVEYPVMISINDPNAFHKTGFVFRFAFPVQIFHNAPDRSLQPASIIEVTEYALDFCGFPEETDRNIIVRDAVTNAELSKVNLTFRCMTEECALGTTRTHNRHLQWTGKFPAGCMNPLIVANKSGYLTAEKQFEGSDPFYMDMYPTQEVRFDLKRHLETAPGVARFLDPDMYAIIQLDLIEPAVPMTVFDVIGGDEIFNRTERFELLRDDATYSLNIMLIKKVSKDEDMLVGGWIGNWSVTLNDMLDAEKIVFHVAQKFPTPKTESDVVNVYPLMVNRSLYPEIVPVIVRADEYAGEEAAST